MKNYVFIYINSQHRWTAYYPDKTKENIIVHNFEDWLETVPSSTLVIIVKYYHVTWSEWRQLIEKIQTLRYNKTEFQQLCDLTLQRGSYTLYRKD